MEIHVEPVPEDEIERSAEINYRRRQLGEAIAAAQIALGNAKQAHQRLIDLYDVEYAEDGSRFASFLADADKALYAAQLIAEKRNG